MKLLSCLLAAAALFSACKMKEEKRIDMNQVNQFQDSIPHLVPGARSIHTVQDNDATNVILIVGSPSFYTASDAAKKKAAINTGLMVLHVLGADNNLKTGTLVISRKDNDSIARVPEDGIKLDMKIDSLSKVLFPKAG